MCELKKAPQIKLCHKTFVHDCIVFRHEIEGNKNTSMEGMPYLPKQR